MLYTDFVSQAIQLAQDDLANGEIEAKDYKRAVAAYATWLQKQQEAKSTRDGWQYV